MSIVEDESLEFRVFDMVEQEILVSLEADDVLRLEGNLSETDARSPIPDPITTFVQVAQRGVLTRSTIAPWLSGAELLSREVDRTSRKQTCRVRIWNIDSGAFRVLANILLARVPERASITTVNDIHGHSQLELASLRYPAPFRATEFSIDYEPPTRSCRERFVQILLARDPTSAELDTIYSGMDSWPQLVLLGGYPAAKMKPWQSAAVAEPAFLLEPRTVEQCFPDLFLCDDDCYAAVVNWANVVHQGICPVAGILLR